MDEDKGGTSTLLGPDVVPLAYVASCNELNALYKPMRSRDSMEEGPGKGGAEDQSIFR